MLYSAVLDNRTTEVCRDLDGLVIPLDHPMLDRLAPPNHFSCRSLLVNVPLGVDLDTLGYEMITDTDVERAIDWGKDHGMESFLANEQGCKCYQSDKETENEPPTKKA